MSGYRDRVAQFYDSDDEVAGGDLLDGMGAVDDDDWTDDEWVDDRWRSGSEADGEEPADRNWVALVAAGFALWLVISVGVLMALLNWHHHSGSTASGPGTQTPRRVASTGSASVNVAPPAPPNSATTAAASPAAPAPGELPAGWTVVASDQQTDCAAHSFGKVKTYFQTSPCVLLTRWLATTTLAGRKAIVSWVIVRTDDSANADQFLTLVSADGTGDVRDLLSDGTHIAGLPTKMPAGAFSSNYLGNTVHIAEAAWADGPSGEETALQKLADQGSVLS